ncbi:putative nucleotidyltransferase substrate binding domain-containing protein [Nocardioides ultimimeridianus]
MSRTTGGAATGGADGLEAFLGSHAPFTSAPAEVVRAAAEAAEVRRYARGELVLDAFTEPNDQIWIVVEGRVDVWNDAHGLSSAADELLGPGGLFGFSSMLTGRAIGPRVVAGSDAAVVARIPRDLVAVVFTSPSGAEFLATQIGRKVELASGRAGYSTVDELLAGPPLTVGADASVRETAKRMTEAGVGYAAVSCADGGTGLVTDADLRAGVLAAPVDPDRTRAAELMDPDPPAVVLGSSAAEALILLQDRNADFLLVTDPGGALRGVVGARDLVVSGTTSGVSLHEQLRRAASVEELRALSGRTAALLADLLEQGLASGRVITVYSAIIDTMIRRAIGLVFARHTELSTDAFTWLSLGSNGRREAVPSSDVDAAVAFDNAVTPAEIDRYRAVFVEVGELLASLGLSIDTHGATPTRRAFARTNDEWRRAAQHWLASPERDEGAIMTSLLVDARPIHGDPGLPEVSKVFGELRTHPGTMRLLLQESLAKRARRRTARDVLNRRRGSFDVKEHALLPIVNLARWSALSAGSSVLPTTDRLRAAGGTAILPQPQAQALVEVFEVLQRLRLRYQLGEMAQGRPPTDVVRLDALTPINRSIIMRAAHEIAGAQRRMENVSTYADPESWTAPER